MKQSRRTREFFRLFMRHQNRIFAYILTLVPHGADAEDIMQETACVAWEKFGTFKEGTDFAAWLKKIAFHKVMDHRKRGGYHRVIFSDDLIRVLAPQAEKTFEKTDIHMAALRFCLKRLSSPDRQLLKRRYEDGLTIKAIAQEADRPVQGLYKVMIRIPNQLRRCVHYSLLSEQFKEEAFE
jgi:RNA polymerase sigma-70 factor (ECF subfamily)